MSRIYREAAWGLLGVVSLAWLAAPLAADVKSGSGSTASASSQSTQALGVLKKDPVEAVFALPHGTRLNAKQQAAFDKLKRQNESALRSAIALAQSKDKTQSAKGLTQGHDLRVKIHAGIRDILAMPLVEAEQSAIRAQQAADANYAARKAYRDRGYSCPCGR